MDSAPWQALTRNLVEALACLSLTLAIILDLLLHIALFLVRHRR